MNTTTEKKPVISLETKVNDPSTAPVSDQSSATSKFPSKNSVEAASAEFREVLKAVDAQRTDLVKSAMDNIKPGRTFDANVVREINKLETKRNRLIVAHFASLLKNHPNNVHAIVHQIIEL